MNGALGRRWLYGYSWRGDLATMTDPEGGVTRYDYDEAHHLVSITDAEGTTVVRNVYDGVGRIVEQRDGAGGRWAYRYSEATTVVTDPLGHTTSYRFDERYRTTGVTDANGATTTLAWDEASNLVAVTDATRRTFRFTFNSRGDPTSAEGPSTAPVQFEWNDRGNLTAVVSGDGHRAEFGWDDDSRPVRLRSPGGVVTTITWHDGLLRSVTDGDGGATEYRFDDAGHLASITDPLGAVTTVDFDAAGRPVAEAHPGGERMAFSWDRCDRLLTVTDDAAATRYSYDRCGRLVSMTDALVRTTRYAYGPLGLLASVTDPLGRQTTFDYDACGRLAARTDPEGRTVSLSYDPAGRLVRVEAAGTTAVEYGWDPAGRLVSMTDATGETTWEFDTAGRPTVEHRPGGIVLRHAYDDLGRRRRLELHQGEALIGTWDYDLDPDGRVITVIDPAGKRTDLGYDSAGRLGSIHHPNGVTSTWTYDLAGQPTAVMHAGPEDELLSSWINAFDADGNLIRSERRLGDGADGMVTLFAYDHLGRVTSAALADDVTSFGWDAASNRTSVEQHQSLTCATYDAGDQVMASGSVRYRYDAAGNLVERIGDGKRRLVCAHDGLGQLIELRVGDETVTYPI